jgi:hypothetical protein
MIYERSFAYVKARVSPSAHSSPGVRCVDAAWEHAATFWGLYGPSGGGSRPRRRRVRPLMLALIIGVMLGAVGAAVFVVTSAIKHTPARLNGRPAAVTSSAPAPSSSAPSGASSSPSASHRAVSSSAPAYVPRPWLP